jgi:succinylarginine dihydrolase
MKTSEINFDGIVGLTHHYSGLAFGNLASTANAHKISNPKAAALQGLKKMHLLMQKGILQAILPPHERPLLSFFKNLGFTGTDTQILKAVYALDSRLFGAGCSASSMWVANAATVTPSADSTDGRVHITPANLMSNLHRALETEINIQIFKKIFSDENYFTIHPPLFSQLDFADEGAANHSRLCQNYGSAGLNLFIYGRSGSQEKEILPHQYPARQTREASKAVARLHQLRSENTIFIKQNPLAIDQGVFHNDVISIANQNVFLFHELAFEDTATLVGLLKKKSQDSLYLLSVATAELSLQDAVKSYIFNSQLVTLGTGAMALIAPIESRENKNAHQVLLKIMAEKNAISELHFVDCKQSMLNGGGPACLRLRMVLTEVEQKACRARVFLDENLYQRLVQWVERHYRDKLSIGDLVDPLLLNEIRVALDELTQILQLGTLYNFQKI